MKEQVEVGKKVWKRYLDNETKSGIAKALGIPRNEVQSIVKYTTADMYLSQVEINTRADKLKALFNDKLREKNIEMKKLRDKIEELKDDNFANNTLLGKIGFRR